MIADEAMRSMMKIPGIKSTHMSDIWNEIPVIFYPPSKK